MAYSALELAASGDAVRALRALNAQRGSNLSVRAFGPVDLGRGSLWRVVLGNHRFSVWAHGLCDGSLALSLHTMDVPGIVQAARAVAPATWKAGELRASGLRPVEAIELIIAVKSYLESQSRCGRRLSHARPPVGDRLPFDA